MNLEAYIMKSIAVCIWCKLVCIGMYEMYLRVLDDESWLIADILVLSLAEPHFLYRNWRKSQF